MSGRELDSSLSVKADCTTVELPHDFRRSVAEGEAGMMGLVRLFGGLPHPAEPLGGGAHVELSPGMEVVGAGTQSGP